MKKLYKVLAVVAVASIFAGCGKKKGSEFQQIFVYINNAPQTTDHGSMSGSSFNGKADELGGAKKADQIGNTRSSANPRSALQDYVQNEDNAKLNGGSYLKFNTDGSVNLEVELCVTTQTDCSTMRQYAVDDDKVKTSRGDTIGKSVRQHYYYRRSIKFTDTQKLSDAEVKADFANLGDYLDFYRINSEDTGADRSKLSGAKMEDLITSKDALHDTSSAEYWRTGQNQTLILAISKEGVLSTHARLGFWAYAIGDGTHIALSTISGEYTKAERLSQVGASYSKAEGWYALGVYNDKSHLFSGDIDIEFDVANKRLTKFDVSNMYRRQLDSKFKPIRGTYRHLINSSAKLQLQGGTSRSYDSRGFYDATLTESGGATGQAGKWEASLRGAFFGPNADETAGSMVAEKNGSTTQNHAVGGFAAAKQ